MNKFLNKYSHLINVKKFFNNLLYGNQDKIICSNSITENKQKLKINQINYKDKFLNIEFNNNITIRLELYMTSEKITSNIPVKYKINIINIF